MDLKKSIVLFFNIIFVINGYSQIKSSIIIAPYVMPKQAYRKLTLMESKEDALLYNDFKAVVDSLNAKEKPKFTMDYGINGGVNVIIGNENKMRYEIEGTGGMHFINHGEKYPGYIINDTPYTLIYSYQYLSFPLLLRFGLRKKKFAFNITGGYGLTGLLNAESYFKPYHEKYYYRDTLLYGLFTKMSYLRLSEITTERLLGFGFEYNINDKTKLTLNALFRNKPTGSLGYFLYKIENTYIAYQRNYSWGLYFSLVRKFTIQ